MTDLTTPATLASGFDFARRQRDPAFRKYLRDIGWTSGQTVVIAHADESIGSLLSRMDHNGVTGRCLVAVPDADAPFGFRLTFAEVP